VGNHSTIGECLPAKPEQAEKVFMAIKTQLAFPSLNKIFSLILCFFSLNVHLHFFISCQKERETYSSAFPLPVLKTRPVIYSMDLLPGPLFFRLFGIRF
jgi:hypothetical protein